MSSGPRHAAVGAILAVVGSGRSLTTALDKGLDSVAESERSLARALSYGVLRHRRRLEAVAARLLSKPLRARDRDVHIALLVGLYQLSSGTTAEHAAVSETASLGRSVGKPWAVRLLNATLRRFQRERSELLAGVDRDPVVCWSLPDWLAAEWRHDWPQQWQGMARAASSQAPLILRVNRRHQSVTDYAVRLNAAGLATERLPGLPDALVLAEAVPVWELPGFADGDVSVQDGSAQFAAPLLAPRPGERVLDACAAPGGKTAHIDAICPGAELVALDSDGDRLDRVRENLDRLDGQATLIAGDAGQPSDWWDGRAFDRILLDAPCSGTGVIRRHPDIKWLRRESDVAALAATQAGLLEALWPLLARGGLMVYATCSVLQAENEAPVGAFLARHPDAESEAPRLPVGWSQAVGHQILIGDSGMDGFYYACLRKG